MVSPRKKSPSLQYFPGVIRRVLTCVLLMLQLVRCASGAAQVVDNFLFTHQVMFDQPVHHCCGLSHKIIMPGVNKPDVSTSDRSAMSYRTGNWFMLIGDNPKLGCIGHRAHLIFFPL